MKSSNILLPVLQKKEISDRRLGLRWEKVNKTLSQKQGEHGDVLL
jgi:hypothetical protein